MTGCDEKVSSLMKTGASFGIQNFVIIIIVVLCNEERLDTNSVLQWFSWKTISGYDRVLANQTRSKLIQVEKYLQTKIRRSKIFIHFPWRIFNQHYLRPAHIY